MSSTRFDPVWEEIYSHGEQLNRYPWDAIVSFVFRNYPRGRKRRDISILEIGCGCGNNLWFAAREGFAVAGIDCSPSAIAFAESRFQKRGVKADLRLGSFDDLPFQDKVFDLAFDRFALSCCGHSVAKRAVRELHRVLKPAGRLFCSPLSNRHSGNLCGTPSGDGLRADLRVGDSRTGQLAFYSREQMTELFAVGWKILTVQHLEIADEGAEGNIYAEWRVTAENI